MERQAKDGTVYQQVSKDEWTPVTRKDKQGNVYKKVGADAWSAVTNEPKESGFGDKALAGLEGFAKSSSMGTLPYMQAAGEVVTDKIAGAIFDSPQSEESFSDRVDRARQRSQSIKDKAPGYSLTGEIAGFLAPGAAISKGVGAAGKALGIQAAAKTAPLTARLAGKSGRLATEGAVFGAAYTPDTGFADIGGRAEAAATGAAFGAIMPPAMHAGGKLLSTAAKVPGWAAKKVLSSLGGVKQEVIEKYLQNPERIRGARTFDELYETTTKIVGQLGDDLDNSKISFENAKKHLDDVAGGIKDSRVEGKEKALQQVQQAKEMLAESFQVKKQGIQRQASSANVEPMVSDALGNLKTKVIGGSNDAAEVLTKKKVSVSKPYEFINNQLKNLSTETADDSKAALRKLREVGKALFKKGKTNLDGEFIADARQIKKMIQSIDRDVDQWELAAGAFDTDYGRQLKGFRRELDSVLKESFPKYKDKMAPVAADAALLTEASKKFGKPDRALSRLGGLDRTSAKYDLETVKALALKEGGDLPQALNDMLKAQRTLKSPIKLDEVKRSLPEASALRTAEMQKAVAKRLASPKVVKEAIKKNAATFKLKSEAEKLQAKKEVFARLKSFGEQGAENKLLQVGRGRKFAEKQLRELSQYADEDLVEAVKAAQDAASFDKTMFSGSRNVNLWAMLGALGQTATGRGGVGAAAGGVFAGPIGLAVGATLGALMDNYGPRVTKQILDGVLRIKGPFSNAAISKMNLPDNIKKELIKQFQLTVVAERATSVNDLDAKEKPKGDEKWSLDGYEKAIQSVTPELQVKYESMKTELLKNPRSRRALISLSDLKPGSKAFENALKELESAGVK